MLFDELPALDGLRVIVADEDADNRELLAFVLRSQGAEALAVGSVSEGVEAVRRFRPDVLIAELTFTGEDVFSLIARVRALDAERGTHVPAIALTAWAAERDIADALAAGFQLHVSKPAAIERIVSLVAYLYHCRELPERV